MHVSSIQLVHLFRQLFNLVDQSWINLWNLSIKSSISYIISTFTSFITYVHSSNSSVHLVRPTRLSTFIFKCTSFPLNAPARPFQSFILLFHLSFNSSISSVHFVQLVRPLVHQLFNLVITARPSRPDNSCNSSAHLYIIMDVSSVQLVCPPSFFNARLFHQARPSRPPSRRSRPSYLLSTSQTCPSIRLSTPSSSFVSARESLPLESCISSVNSSI